MTVDWEIGKEAQELDEKPIIERAKIEKRSIKRIMIAFICYFLTMLLFSFLL